jgi:hypothetical protein
VDRARIHRTASDVQKGATAVTNKPPKEIGTLQEYDLVAVTPLGQLSFSFGLREGTGSAVRA